MKLWNKLFAEIKTVPACLQPSYHPALDGFRGVAILMVLLHHFGAGYYLYPHGVLIDSAAGVHIFFVLSGFLITTLILKEKVKRCNISLGNFYIRRALRILPVAYLFLMVLVGFNMIFGLHISALSFVSSFLFFSNLPINGSYYIAHFWSLAVEVQFYVTFPLLLAYSTNKYLAVVLAIVVFVPLIAILEYYQLLPFAGSKLSVLIGKLCMYAFWKGPLMILLGSLASILVFKRIINLENIKANYFFEFILFVSALIIRSPTFVFYGKYVSEYLSAFMIAYVILLSINSKSFLSVILSSRVMLRIGVLSYSLYIWQQLFVGPNTWQPWMRGFNGEPMWVLLVLKLVFVFAIATVSYYFERKFLRIKQRLVH
jgi:peptidoglycan/LPS O-acetylase OafA/YrhL